MKSNHGTKDFIPIDGRWVVERTFSWLGGMRCNNCNYEKYLRTACHVATVACVAFMLRYSR